MILYTLIAIVVILAAANGANDNIKGAATLLASGVLRYRAAIVLATVVTAVGGLTSIFIANGLIQAFSGKGIVPQELTVSASFLLAIAIGAAAAVWLATFAGMPVSTTHALFGGIVGAGLAVSEGAVSWGTAAKLMLLPLLISPLLAAFASFLIAPLLRKANAPAAEPCLCADTLSETDGKAIALRSTTVLGRVDEAQCMPTTGRTVLSFPLLRGRDMAHLASACAVSFARGLNDTPKIAALMVAAGASVSSSSLTVVMAMSLGGLVAAQRVAKTLAFRVVKMNPSEGLAGNIVTAALVIGASRFGLPVSTTHVGTGALFGIGVSNGSTHWNVVRTILLAWVFTLPASGVVAYIAVKVLS